MLKYLRRKKNIIFLSLIALLFAAGFLWQPKTGGVLSQTVTETGRQQSVERHFEFFSFIHYQPLEKYGLMMILAIAVCGLIYAFMLIKQMSSYDRGTPKMQEIAGAVREGANAYLIAQFKKISIFIVIITCL